MGYINGGDGDVGFLKRTFRETTARGEKLRGYQYEVNVEGLKDLTYLISTTAFVLPKREMVEEPGPQGLTFKLMGKLLNSQEVPVTIQVPKDPRAVAFLRRWVENKEYRDIEIRLKGEGHLNPDEAHINRLDSCWPDIDPAELGFENGQVLQVSGTLYVNWVGEMR